VGHHRLQVGSAARVVARAGAVKPAGSSRLALPIRRRRARRDARGGRAVRHLPFVSRGVRGPYREGPRCQTAAVLRYPGSRRGDAPHRRR
jgi:hypothetical protein